MQIVAPLVMANAFHVTKYCAMFMPTRYKLVKNFNEELNKLNEHSRGKQVNVEGTNEEKMHKFIMEPFSKKCTNF
jgi:hypothetical protein